MQNLIQFFFLLELEIRMYYYKTYLPSTSFQVELTFQLR